MTAKGINKKQKCISLKPSTIAELKRYAEEEGYKESTIIERAISMWIKECEQKRKVLSFINIRGNSVDEPIDKESESKK